MKKQAIVIGLGQFGLSVARSLTERGVEVLAADIAEDRVRAASSVVTEAACFDATDIDALTRAAPGRREVCVCAIGDESKEASIICTALLRQLGAPRVIARANDEVHARILELVGAHQVVNPDREFGERFASRLVHAPVVGELPLGDDLLITELRPPPAILRHPLGRLDLADRFGITVVAIRRQGVGSVLLPQPTEYIREGDILVVISTEDAIERFIERV
jgi:trk system potassium uptake protein TrkA